MVIKLTAIGDSLFSSRNLKNRIPEQVAQLFKSSDLAFTNAEFTTPKKETPVAAGRGYVTSV